MDEFTEEELQEEYDNFIADYKPEYFEDNEDNRKLIGKLNPKLVWTSHSTCEDNYIAPGFLQFSPSNCCWHEDGWYVSEKEWESDDSTNWVRTSYNFNCPDCNPDGESDEGADGCEKCEGSGYYQYYTD